MASLTHPQYWINHYSFAFPPPGLSRQPAPGKKLAIQIKEQTEADFKSILAEFADSSRMFRLRMPDMEAVHFKLHSFGKTSLVVRWYRQTEQGYDSEAMTLCLGGINTQEDEAAVAYVFDTILGPGLSEQDARVYADNVRKLSRPAGVRIHFDATSYDNQALRVCSSCLAVAFFSAK